MKSNRCLLLLIVLFIPSSLLANSLYFPQIAYGGGYSTTLVIMNTGTAAVVSQLRLYTQTGVALNPTNVNIPVGGSARFSITDPGPTINVAWGVITADTSTVQGVATFDFRFGNGVLQTTAGVLGVEAGNSFLLPVDVTSSASTGVAIANATTGPVFVNLRLIREDGSPFAAVSDARVFPLGARRQIADFVTSMFSQLATTTFRGSLVVEAAAGSPAGSLAITALTVKEGLLSALPVIPGIPSGGGGGGPGSGQ